ncbi:Alpha/beta hydrolase family protein [Candidatus Bealeia paramacronuclearis]|uniref:Alpha/beta hydrolase family protein n=1 Tax=Candidatus Bealeia paramacronuclearis TaxID=1921001 RepID=A0ABZ2C5L7_9PROT|nr:Alpha/beta hydrolase family protein [Candidatus Bealeia paramacronuclearis]
MSKFAQFLIGILCLGLFSHTVIAGHEKDEKTVWTSATIPHREGKEAQGLVVIFHGYSASGKDIIPLASSWQKEFPYLDFIAPNGVDPYEGQGSDHYQWFSLKNINLQKIQEKEIPILAERLEKLRPSVMSFLDNELQKRNLTRVTQFAGEERRDKVRGNIY